MGRVLRPSLGVLSVAVDAVDSARAANLAKSETRVGPNVWSGPTCSSTLVVRRSVQVSDASSAWSACHVDAAPDVPAFVAFFGCLAARQDDGAAKA